MRRAIALILAVAACAGAPAKAPDKSTVAPAPLTFDRSMLDGFYLPKPGNPFVLVDGELGILLSTNRRGEGHSGVLYDARGPVESTTVLFVEDLDKKIVSTTWAGGDAPPPAKQEAISDEEVQKRLLAQDPPSTSQEIVRTLVVARELEAHSHAQLAEALLRTIAPDQESLRRSVREAVSSMLTTRAVRLYASGGRETELVDNLTVAAGFGDTNGARAASDALVAARSIDAQPKQDGSPLDALVRKRIHELHQATCNPWAVDDQWPGNDPVGRIRSLGYTAIPALYDAQADAHLSRCLLDGDPASLLTVGKLARDTVQRITRGGETFDASDVECGHEGYDKEAVDLIDAALAKHDVPQAIAITKSALGKLRVTMIEKLGNVGGADVVAFLRQEAVTGPVVLARVEAARTLTAASRAWVAPMIDAVQQALVHEDAPHPRCDGDRVIRDGFRELLRVSPRDTLAALEARQKTQGPFGVHALIALAPILATFTPTSATEARSRDALLGSMLDDVRPSKGMSMTYQGMTCTDPTPSDLAAITLGKRLGVSYACTADADAKHASVQQIQSKMSKP